MRETPNCSWTIRARIPIMAARPWLSSMALGKLGLLVEGVPAKVEGVVAEVTNELSAGDVLHDGKLKETNEGNQLSNSGSRDGVEGGETVGDIGEGKSGVVNVSGKTDSGLGNEVSDNGKHGDTSVLDLDVSEALELFFITIGKSE